MLVFELWHRNFLEARELVHGGAGYIPLDSPLPTSASTTDEKITLGANTASSAEHFA
jgi:hypothetical protein